MKRILCEDCGTKQGLRDGERKLPVSKFEPVEYQRVTWGTARIPTSEQRTVWVDDVPHQLELSGYTCDSCSALIKPGQRCCAFSAWHEGHLTVEPAWENEYLTPESQG